MKNLKWMYLFLGIGCAISSLISTTIFSTLMSGFGAGIYLYLFIAERSKDE